MKNNKRYTPGFVKLPENYANFIDRIQRGERPKIQV